MYSQICGLPLGPLEGKISPRATLSSWLSRPSILHQKGSWCVDSFIVGMAEGEDRARGDVPNGKTQMDGRIRDGNLLPRGSSPSGAGMKVFGTRRLTDESAVFDYNAW